MANRDAVFFGVLGEDALEKGKTKSSSFCEARFRQYCLLPFVLVLTQSWGSAGNHCDFGGFIA
jgi:hypothetical protein